MAELRDFILEEVYNEKRLNSALGYLPGTRFEAQLAAQNQETAVAAADGMSFLRHGEIYPSDGMQNREWLAHPRPALIGLYESPAGYSWGLALQQCSLRFTGRDQNALRCSCWATIRQQTENSLLTVCVTHGDNPRFNSQSGLGRRNSVRVSRRFLSGDCKPIVGYRTPFRALW